MCNQHRVEIINVDDRNGRGSSDNLADIVHPSNMEVYVIIIIELFLLTLKTFVKQ